MKYVFTAVVTNNWNETSAVVIFHDCLCLLRGVILFNLESHFSHFTSLDVVYRRKKKNASGMENDCDANTINNNALTSSLLEEEHLEHQAEIDY